MTLRKFVDAGVLLAIGFLIGLMLADVSSAEQTARDWQTLAAGILAVIAAAWTVAEMRRNDRNQQERHEQIIGQSDIERRRQMNALALYAEVVENNAEMYQKAFACLISATNTDEKRKALTEIFTANDVAISTVLNADFVDRRKFFTGQLAMAYASIEKLAGSIKTLRDSIMNGKIKTTDEWIEESCPRLAQLDGQVHLTMSVLAQELRSAGEASR